MNTLSWFLYLAEISEVLKSFGIGISILLTFILMMWWSLHLFLEEKDRPERPNIWIHLIYIFALCVAILTPSTRTMYLIIASEVGEATVNSPAVEDTMNDIRTIIKNYAKNEE